MGRPRGFTLVEVMVALVVMAVIAGLAWQGVDSLLRSRELSRSALERTVRLGTVLTQWQQDLAAVQDTGVVPALAFDGRALRLTRHTDEGIRLVVWTLQGPRWLRWAAPPVTRVAALQEQWLRSQQLPADDPLQVRLLEPVGAWSVYCFRGNGWSHCQSSGDLVEAAEPPAGAASAAAAREALPGAVRLQLEIDGQRLVRDIALGPQTP